MNDSSFNRRQFIQLSTAATAAGIVSGGAISATASASTLAPIVDVSLKGRIYKTLKIGMTSGVKGSLTDKFKACKEAGFEGIEMDIPGMDVEATKAAITESGLPVDGSVISTHWSIRHTDKSEKTRAKALKHLLQAIRETHAVGGNTVLLVLGHGNDGSEAEIWKRAIDNIRLALPLCARLGMYIAIENVWNHFLYDHGGDHKQSAQKFVKFVDELNSPWVGLQFDIGNHRKYGNMADWIRQLGKRIVKLDLKGYSRKDQGWRKIGKGDIDWADVRKALDEINYVGWAAAEVGGGDLERLREISANMDTVFNLK